MEKIEDEIRITEDSSKNDEVQFDLFQFLVSFVLRIFTQIKSTVNKVFQSKKIIKKQDSMIEMIGNIGINVASEAVEIDQNKLRKKLTSLKNAIHDSIQKAKIKIDEKVNTAHTLRQIDKYTFFFGVIIFCLDFFIMGKYPDSTTYNFKTGLAIVLITWRHIHYRYNIYHYFLFDFCYVGNYTIFIMLYYFPTSKFLYTASFAFAFGTIGWAAVLVRNSFVLHSIDKLTSFSLHFSPVLLMCNLHWVTQYNKKRGWDLYDKSRDKFTLKFSLYFFMAATTIYLIWAFLYYLLIFVIRAKRIKEKNYLTLYKYMSEADKTAAKLWKMCGEEYSGVLFMFTHFIIFLVTTFFALLAYFYFYVSLASAAIIFSLSVWRGGCFYMDYFWKKYELNLNQIEEIYKKELLENSKKELLEKDKTD